MRAPVVILTAVIAGLLVHTTAVAGDPAADAKVISNATAGKLKSTHGRVFDETCGTEVDYQAEVIDLNGDGKPEVFTRLLGGCFGMAGVHLDLLVQDKDSQWKSQFGFPGDYTILETKHLGYPDIEIGGPGDCSPVWRWDGAAYDIHKKCPI